MDDLQNLQELLGLLQDQERLILLMEEQQAEIEKLEEALAVCREQRAQTETRLEETQRLNEKLNGENRRLTQQIESWNSLQT